MAKAGGDASCNLIKCIIRFTIVDETLLQMCGIWKQKDLLQKQQYRVLLILYETFSQWSAVNWIFLLWVSPQKLISQDDWVLIKSFNFLVPS